MKERIADGLFVLGVVILIAFVVFVVTDGVHAAPQSEPGCVEIGAVGDEVLYLCETDYGVRCVWDASEVLGAGVMDCEW